MTLRSAAMLVILVLVVMAPVAVWLGTRHQRAALTADTERLINAGAAHPRKPAIDDHTLATLPPPVARYLRLALPSPKDLQEVRITQNGTLRTDATAERWMPFEAEHLVVPDAAGFLWEHVFSSRPCCTCAFAMRSLTASDRVR